MAGRGLSTRESRGQWLLSQHIRIGPMHRVNQYIDAPEYRGPIPAWLQPTLIKTMDPVSLRKQARPEMSLWAAE